MGRFVSYKELKISDEITQLYTLAENLRKERDAEVEEYTSAQNLHCMLNSVLDLKIELEMDLSSFAGKILDGMVFSIEENRPKPTEQEARLKKLLALLARIKTASLGRIGIDFKSMFRAKVPLLFKNLDDAHITNQIANILKFDLSYIPHYIKRETRKYQCSN